MSYLYQVVDIDSSVTPVDLAGHNRGNNPSDVVMIPGRPLMP